MLYMIPPHNNYGQDYSAYWDDLLTDQEIDYFLYHKNWKTCSEGQIGIDPNNTTVDNTYRKTSVCWINVEPDNLEIWDKITKSIAKVNSKFFHYELTGCYEPMQLGLYTSVGQGGHYDWHTDYSVFDNIVPRKLSMVISLSDNEDFDGGELQIKTFNDDPITLETKKGRAWFFPSFLLHRVTPVTKGIRKSLVLWIGGPSFR